MISCFPSGGKNKTGPPPQTARSAPPDLRLRRQPRLLSWQTPLVLSLPRQGKARSHHARPRTEELRSRAAHAEQDLTEPGAGGTGQAGAPPGWLCVHRGSERHRERRPRGPGKAVASGPLRSLTPETPWVTPPPRPVQQTPRTRPSGCTRSWATSCHLSRHPPTMTRSPAAHAPSSRFHPRGPSLFSIPRPEGTCGNLSRACHCSDLPVASRGPRKDPRDPPICPHLPSSPPRRHTLWVPTAK